jgi:hypothetical protein
MALNYGSYDFRKMIIDEIKAVQNQEQKRDSLKQFEIYRGRLHPYVQEYLRRQLSEQTIQEMPVVCSINVLKRVVKQMASLYNEAPDRQFVNCTDEQIEVLKQVYKDLDINCKMQKANEIFKFQDQVHLQLVPNNKKLSMRCLMRHHIDVVPSPDNPEMADAYIVNGFDRSMFAPRLSDSEDGHNQIIADPEDYKSKTVRFAVWSNEFNFIMNDEASIVSGPDVSNPLGIMPFVDIANYKDYEYFNRLDMCSAEFTIQLNAMMSEIEQVMRMQGFSVAYLKAPESLIPQSVQIGPNYLLKLPINENNPVETEFGFATPSADLAGSIQVLETSISMYLTSIGEDPNTVSGKGEVKKYSSGVERLLAMISRFEASRTDMDLFEQSEQKIFKIVAQYLNTYAGTDVLDYKIAPISDDAYIQVQFKKPEMIQSENEKLEMIRSKLELSLITQQEAIMLDRGVDEDAAKEIYESILANQNLQQAEEKKQEQSVNGEDNRDESIS